MEELVCFHKRATHLRRYRMHWRVVYRLFKGGILQINSPKSVNTWDGGYGERLDRATQTAHQSEWRTKRYQPVPCHHHTNHIVDLAHARTLYQLLKSTGIKAFLMLKLIISTE